MEADAIYPYRELRYEGVIVRTETSISAVCGSRGKGGVVLGGEDFVKRVEPLLRERLVTKPSLGETIRGQGRRGCPDSPGGGANFGVRSLLLTSAVSVCPRSGSPWKLQPNTSQPPLADTVLHHPANLGAPVFLARE